MWELADNDPEKYKQGRSERPGKHPKLRISLKLLALAQNSNSVKENSNLSTCQDSRIAFSLRIALQIVNFFQPLVAGNVSYSGKYRFLKFKYLQMSTYKQTQFMEKHLSLGS